MATEVIFPRVDMGMESGRISRWLVEAGAPVDRGQPLFEIETDKAAMEIEAPAKGVLASPAACDVPLAVGQVVGWILAEGEAAPSLPGGGAPTSAAGPAPAPPSRPGPAQPGAGGVRATPLARRLARQNGIDLTAVPGSGPRGRVVRDDVLAAVARGGAAAAPSAAGVRPAGSGVAEAAPAAPAPEVVPHDRMRRTIARRLVESKQTVPHFYLTTDCTLDALLSVRAEINAEAREVDGRPEYRISVNDFVIKAFAIALRRVPDANVIWTEDALLKQRSCDIGVAISVPGGLVTPVVRRAEARSLLAISEEMKDLAARARSRKLRPEESQGGAAAISNLGMFGVREFAAIINPPHASILAIGAAEERVIARRREPVVATQLTATLSVDHRAIDGALGAELLAAFKAAIEKPLVSLL